MRRERAAKYAAEALGILSVPKVISKAVHNMLPLVIIEAVHDVRPSAVPPPDEVQFFSCCVDRLCRSVDDQLSTRQVCINCNCIAHLVCSKALDFQPPVDITFVVSAKDFTNAAKSRIKAIPKSEHGNIHFSAFYAWPKSK